MSTVQCRTGPTISVETVAESTVETSVRIREGLTFDMIDLEDLKFQVRKSVDQETVNRYVDVIDLAKGMGSFSDKVTLWKRADGKHVVVDGFHRLQAAQKAGVSDFPAEIIEGSEEDAMIQAATANFNHSLPLSKSERLEACRRVIKSLERKDQRQPSNGRVAKILGLPESTFRKYRTQLEEQGRLVRPEKVIGKDGKTQAARKKKCTSPPAASEGSGEDIIQAASMKSDEVVAAPGMSYVADRIVPSTGPATISTPVAQQNGNSLATVADYFDEVIKVLECMKTFHWTGHESEERLRFAVNELLETAQDCIKAHAV